MTTAKELAQLSDRELLIDLAEAEAEINVCQRALDLDIQDYPNGGSTLYRLKVNRDLAEKIRAELESRSTPVTISTSKGECVNV